MFQRGWWVILFSGALAAAEGPTGNVIFLHPDGTSIGSWMATRLREAGPAGRLNWDELPNVAVYDGRLRDSLAASSHGGATTHAWGVRAPRENFGFIGPGARSLSGFAGPLMKEAQAAGKAVGLVQTGAHFEPGSAVHLVSAPKRSDEAAIMAALVESGAAVLLGGGEALFLPEGAAGRHGPGKRQDGRNLVAEAQHAGYTVLYTRDELAAVAEVKPGAKFLGLFAAGHTFNDRTEEELRAAGLPHYQPQAPTYAEMTAFALRVLAQAPRGFFLVAEEEGTDNFAGNNNAPGTLEAHARADAGIGVARAFLATHPDTLVLTASDSNAGGMTIVGPQADKLDPAQPLPARTSNGAPLDGREGTGTPPFMAKPDENGRALPFGISWGTGDDSAGGVVVRADGLNAGRVRGSMDNVDVYRVMYLTLFGRELARP
ncbi:MAG: alkaline phosphatase [Opitutus sp.]|nr:alkaline phosphatase [Opitutus sp.]